MGKATHDGRPLDTIGIEDVKIRTSMSSGNRRRGRCSTTQQEYPIFSPDAKGSTNSDSVSSDMSQRSSQLETSQFHDADTDFRDSEAQTYWKEIYTDTHNPEFEQMHPLRPLSPGRFLENVITRQSSPCPSGHLHHVVDKSQGMLPPSRVTNSPRSKYLNSSASPDNSYGRGYISPASASVTNSPQHPCTWSPHWMERRPNLPPLEIPSPTASEFGGLTPTTSKQVANSELAKALQDLRGPRMSPTNVVPAKDRSPPHVAPISPASSVKSSRRFKFQQSNPNMSPRPSVSKDKAPAKSWKNPIKSIPPIFSGRKGDNHNTFRDFGKDIGASFQGSKRRGHVNTLETTASIPNWSGCSGGQSTVAPDIERETSGDSDSSELPRIGSKKDVKSGSQYGRFNFLNWGRKKSNGAKANELFQPSTGVLKLDSNSFKVMDYTIKTLQHKLEQANKKEQTTAMEVGALQSAVEAAEEKCQQLHQRCQELELQLLAAQSDAKNVGWDNPKHRRESISSMGTKKGRPFMNLEVTPQLFTNAFEDSKICIKRLASAICIHIRDSGESATQVITSLLEQHKVGRWVSRMPRNVIVLYFESFLHQVLFESFENVSFEPNGAFNVIDQDSLRHACRQAYQDLRKQDWATIEESLGKAGSMVVNATFHRFLVIRMELILSQLGKVADKETSLTLMAAFFNAVKSVWLLHHLAFACDYPVTIFRVAPATDFDAKFMDQVTVFEEEPVRSKISIMVNPGFIVNRQTIKCQVFCSSRYQ